MHKSSGSWAAHEMLRISCSAMMFCTEKRGIRLSSGTMQTINNALSYFLMVLSQHKQNINLDLNAINDIAL